MFISREVIILGVGVRRGVEMTDQESRFHVIARCDFHIKSGTRFTSREISFLMSGLQAGQDLASLLPTVKQISALWIRRA